MSVVLNTWRLRWFVSVFMLTGLTERNSSTYHLPIATNLNDVPCQSIVIWLFQKAIDDIRNRNKYARALRSHIQPAALYTSILVNVNTNRWLSTKSSRWQSCFIPLKDCDPRWYQTLHSIVMCTPEHAVVYLCLLKCTTHVSSFISPG